MFNMILKDGTRSDNTMTFKDDVQQRHDYLLPLNKKITKVTIHYKHIVHGFRFHLSDGSEWLVGRVDSCDPQFVDIADNEVIVGFKYKSDPMCPAVYAEWQFITA